MYDRQESKCVCGRKIVWNSGGKFWVHAEYISDKEKHIVVPDDEKLAKATRLMPLR